MKKYFILIFIFILTLGVQIHANEYGVGKNSKNERPNCSNKTITDNNGYCIGPDKKYIYLTFDCGYENGYTMEMINILNETDTKAAFFITGHYLKSSKDIVNKMIESGHIIANHTYSHKSFSFSNPKEILDDVKKLEDEYYNTFNISLSKYVRPPKGEYTLESQKILSENGYKSIFWSLAYVDWNKDIYNGNHYSYNKVLNKIHNGAIILMHTVSKDNLMDLKDIIISLKEEGYVFKSLDDLCYNNNEG